MRLVVLLGLLATVISAAVQPWAVSTGKHLMQARFQEATGLQYDAQGDHFRAARCYYKAAEGYKQQACLLEKKRDYSNAVDMYAKALAMHAAASAHERAVLRDTMVAFKCVGQSEQVFFACLIGEYAEVGQSREQGLMHSAAAHNCHMAAIVFGCDGDREQRLSMGQAAIGHYKKSVQCALLYGGHGDAAHILSLAVDCCRALGHLDDMRLMRRAEAVQREAHAVNRAAQGDHLNAALSFRQAAEAYNVVGDADKARLMDEAAAKHHELRAVELEADDEIGKAAFSNSKAADVYETLGQSDKAESLRRTAGQQHEALALEYVTLGEKVDAIGAYTRAAGAYEKVGDAEKAKSMREAVTEIENMWGSTD